MKDELGHGSNPHDGVTNNGGGFYARASQKGGRALGQYGPHIDRDNAATDAWQRHPTATQVSTSRGPYGMDIQWHSKENHVNDQGHAWGSPEALADFKAAYARGRASGNEKNRSEGKAFRSGKSEITRLRKQGK